MASFQRRLNDLVHRAETRDEGTAMLQSEMNELLGLAPTDHDLFIVHQQWGDLLLGDQRYEEAERRFTKALPLAPGDLQLAYIHLQLARCKAGKRHYDNALDSVNTSLRLLEPYPAYRMHSVRIAAKRLRDELERKLRPPLWQRILEFLGRSGSGIGVPWYRGW